MRRLLLSLFFFFAIPLAAAEAPFLNMGPTPYGQGFFSVFTSVLGLLDKYDTQEYSGFSLNFANKGLYYDQKKGPNWWGYYFMPLEQGVNYQQEPRCSGQTHLHLAMHCVKNLSKERCHELITKYIQVRPYIQEKLDAFTKEHFDNHFVLGIHYRGTDKMGSEAPKLGYEPVFTAITNYLYDSFPHIPLIIFVASDEEEFVNEIENRFPGQIVCLAAMRSSDGRAIHYKRGTENKFKIGEEALLDCLLLSRCNHLIRTSSNLSLCATYFNPDLSVELLNPGIMD